MESVSSERLAGKQHGSGLEIIRNIPFVLLGTVICGIISGGEEGIEHPDSSGSISCCYFCSIFRLQ